jgi:hypothetical protein
MSLSQDQIEQIATAMYSVYTKNMRRHLSSDVPAPAWDTADAEDRIVWRAMALRAFKELREMGLVVHELHDL